MQEAYKTLNPVHRRWPRSFFSYAQKAREKALGEEVDLYLLQADARQLLFSILLM